MNTRAHLAVGQATIVAAATLTHPHPGWQVAAQLLPAMAGALATSGGHTSPDVDNQGWWKAMDRRLPDEWFGHGGPLQHRGLLHWWGLPTLAWWAWHTGHITATGPLAALATGAWLAWCSHLAADALVGEEGPGHGRGIPVLPWWGHVGAGIPNDSWRARTIAALVAVAAALTVWHSYGLPTPPLATPTATQRSTAQLGGTP